MTNDPMSKLNPSEERDGPWSSPADLDRLRSLPPGTRLYAAPSDAEVGND